MADKILIFKTQGIIVRATYSEDQKQVTEILQDTRPGLNEENALQARLNETAIPGFLNPRDKLENQAPANADLYIHIGGEVIYYVRVQDAHPYTYVASQFYTPLEHEVTDLTHVSQFGLSDGSFRYELRHGSGYVYGVDFHSFSTGGTPMYYNQTPTPGQTALPRDTWQGRLGRDNLVASIQQEVFRDALTFKEYIVELEIEQPTCNLLIDSVDTTPESAAGAFDGTITVNATSDNAIEYKLDSGAWQDSNVFTGLVDDQYTIYARDKNQPLCIQQTPVSVEEIPCDIVIDEVKILHESFRDRGDGRIIVLASSERTIEYSLDYLNFQDSNVFPNLAPGVYRVYIRLKAANTCSVGQDAEVKQGILISTIIDDVECGQSPTGRLYITTLGGDSTIKPLTYLWEDGTPGHDLQNIKPGDYTVTATTVDGRSQDFTYTVNGQPPIIITATVDQGTVTLSVSGGEAPYTFLWNDGSTSQNRQGLDPDTYTVTVTDGRSCSKQENIFVRIPQHYFSENKIALEVFAFDLNTKPNFTYICQIYLEEDYLSNKFTLIGEEEHSVDDEGKTVFEVNEYLDAYLEPTLPAGSPGEVNFGLVRLDSQFKRFYLRFTEKYGVDPTLSTFSQQETFYVLLGGLSFEEYSTKDFFLHYLPEQRPFYTWQPLEKEVFPQQPEFLHYLINDDNLTEFRVWMKLYHEDGTTEEHQIFRSTDAINGVSTAQYEIFRFPAGYDQLSIGGYSCQTCYRYELYVTDSNDVQISEARSYIVNHEYYEEQNFFFFLNSLGCYDTLAATGRSRYQLGIDEETITKELPYDYKATDRSVEVLKKTGSPEVLQPVGYPTKEMMLSLQDFVLSKAYYKWEDNRVIPITVDIRRSTILDKDENLQELDFTYQLPRMEKFTPKLKTASPILLTAQTTVQDTTTARDDGAITVQADGGQPPYTYQWADGPTTQNRQGLVAGTYEVSIRDSSSPARATSVCQLIVRAPAPEYTIVSPYQVNNTFYYQQPPAAAFDPNGREPGWQIDTSNVITVSGFTAGTYEVKMYLYLPALASVGAESGQGTISLVQLGNYTAVLSHLSQGSITIRDQWQLLHTQMVFPPEFDPTDVVGIRADLFVTPENPVYYLSDIQIIIPD